MVDVGGEAGVELGVSSSMVGEAVADVGGEVNGIDGWSEGDSSIRVGVGVGRVGQSLLVSMAVVIVEVGDPRGNFIREVSSRVRCLRMPVGGVGLEPPAFRGLVDLGIMGKCRRPARGKEN
jgi:hypothetical protein